MSWIVLLLARLVHRGCVQWLGLHSGNSCAGTTPEHELQTVKQLRGSIVKRYKNQDRRLLWVGLVRHGLRIGLLFSTFTFDWQGRKVVAWRLAAECATGRNNRTPFVDSFPFTSS
jgi:hypothetical protein